VIFSLEILEINNDESYGPGNTVFTGKGHRYSSPNHLDYIQVHPASFSIETRGFCPRSKIAEV
jgi:hypothetical protein